MLRNPLQALLVPSTLALLATASHAQGDDANWPHFRGGSGTSVLAERDYPVEWGPEKNLAWSVEVEGSGWSSPIVVGDRVFLTAAVDPTGKGPMGMTAGTSDPSTFGGGAKPEVELTYRVTCRSLADGKLLWSRDVGKGVPAYAVHSSNTFATESPASDGRHLFVTFGALGEVIALDLDGAEKWRVETGVHKTGNDFGWGISLVAADGAVFLQNDNEEASFLAAFEADTGEQRWRAERKRGSSWGTPIVVEVDGRRSLVACGSDSVIGYDLASGEEHWRLEGFGGSFSSSPTTDGEHVYCGNSGPMSRGPLMAVPLSSKGKAELAWREERAGPGFASPVVRDGLIYILGSSNLLACHDAATGERLWRERLPEAVQVVASPWIAGDELFIMDEEGTTVVLATGPDFEILGTNELPGLYWSTPSVAGDALLIREARSLHCIRE